MAKSKRTYQEIYNNFQWQIPRYYNIGTDICDKWASRPSRVAVIYEREDGKVEKYTFSLLKKLSNRLANALLAHGLGRGDRFGILLAQQPETVVSHIAVYKIGAVAVPLFTLFGPDALEYRLRDSGAKALVVDEANLDKIMEIRGRLPELRTIIVVGGQAPAGVFDFQTLIEKGSEEFSPERVKADDPALIIYTSGTTGPPKGALHAHRTLLGHLPGVELPHNFFPQPGDLFWTPADWAWIGGLIDVLFPCLHHGVPALARRFRKFDPEEAFRLMADHKVRNTFMPPTALKLMRQAPNPRRYGLSLRSVGSGGETLGEELLDWGKEALGLTINEFYGQTECNLMIGCCSEIMEVRPGSMGKAMPGHQAEVIDSSGNPLPPGQVGEIAIKRPNPVMFLEYWKNPQASAGKFIGDWLLTGDTARKDEDGYFWFHGRTDDIITSGGYRIGPTEIENCLLKHSAVAMAAAIGVPDEIRGEAVKAFIVLKDNIQTGPRLETDIKEFVKKRAAAHQYPREIEFVENLPLTATGKIKRKDLKEMEAKRQP